jgi:hypothetical protein
MMQLCGEHSVDIEALPANALLAISSLVESLEKHRAQPTIARSAQSTISKNLAKLLI